MERKTTNQALSRQRRWQLRQKAANRCIICGSRASRQNRELCPTHRDSRNERRREREVKRRPLTSALHSA